jgi:putative thioredoxin
MSETAAGWIFDVGEADFEAAVIERSRERPVVVDFWAPWCQPCRLLGPLLERLVTERQGQVLLAKVNVDDNPGLADAFQISGIPAVKAIRDGRLVLQFEGLLPEAQLRAFLDRLAPSAGERQLNRAEAEESADPAAAERHYRQLIEKDQDNAAARVGLARVLFAQDRLDEIPDLLAEVPSDGNLGEEAASLNVRVQLRQKARGLPGEAELRRQLAERSNDARLLLDLGVVLAAAGRFEPALQSLLSAGERDPNLATGPVREAMVQVFYALGASHPLANDYRARLAGLLY